jgi:hypothetical protein
VDGESAGSGGVRDEVGEGAGGGWDIEGCYGEEWLKEGMGSADASQR